MLYIFVLLLSLVPLFTEDTPAPDPRPNVILIMADDMGYECLGSYGSHYATPVLDSLAGAGLRFTNAISQPLCTPSRVKLMTGLRNFRNYTHFGHLARNQHTVGNLMKDAGYATLIAGKWQLNGIYSKEPDASDPTVPQAFGFDEYSLWQLTRNKTETAERYARPLIEKNGQVLGQEANQYGPDLFVDHIVDFMERKKSEPFFVYYPMVLVHDPFVPTPDSEEWADSGQRYRQDTAYFREMVSYADKMVGRIVRKVQQLGLDNTVIIFTGDNGTYPSIYTPTRHGIIQGGKGTPTDAGTKVPLLVSWPEKIKQGRVTDGLVEFSDFYATLADLTHQTNVFTDGISFKNVIDGAPDTRRESVMVYYDPQWGKFQKALFVRDKRYKLYHDGKFFDLNNDVLEKNPLRPDKLPPEAREAYAELSATLEERFFFPASR